MTYKRIIQIKSEETSDLLSHAMNDLTIRPGRCGTIGEYVLESPSGLERQYIDRLVTMFNVEQP